MKYSVATISLIVCVILLTSTGFAQIPQTMNYQGLLTQSDGTTPVNGTVQMTFALYDAQTGGNLVWSEPHTAITVEDGIYSVILGTTTPFTDVAFDDLYYLQVSVDGEEMTPRHPLTSVPYALGVAAGGTITITGTNSALNLAGGETYLHDVVHPDPASPPDFDGFRIRRDVDFFGANADALVIEKTDGNSNEPDGGIAFVNTGADGIPDPSLVITGEGLVGIGKTDPLFSVDIAGNLNVENTMIVGGNLLLDGSGNHSIFGNGDQTLTVYPNGSAWDSRNWMVFWGANGGARAGELELAGTYLKFRYGSSTQGWGQVGMTLTSEGKLGIGTTAPTEKLTVNGNIKADSIVATAGNVWPDYVFDDEYTLPSLTQVAEYIQTHRHLPGVPTQADVEKEGVNLGQMQSVLLQKIEELTLHLINVSQEQERLQEENARLKARISHLEQRQ